MADFKHQDSHPAWRTIFPWVVVACGMLFYCFNYFLRVSPSVLQSNLTDAFHITATQFGTLAGLYYWAYTPMQIPAGMLYDKFGVRFVLCVAILVAVVGLSIFIAADEYALAGCGRFLIGLGCAFAYIGTLKIASIWLPTNQFGTVAGLATAIGMLSGTLSQTYLSKVIQTTGYQEALHIAVLVGIALSALVLLIVRNKPAKPIHHQIQNAAPMNSEQLVGALRIILRNKQMWLIGAIGCLLYLPSSVFLDLWGMPYLKAVYHISQSQAVSIASCVFYGWIVSGPTIGIISDKIIRRRVLPLSFTGSFAALLLCFVFYTPNLPIAALYPIFFSIGFCCGAHSLCFALGKENNPIQISGTAVAVTNMFIMIGGAIFQPVVGKLLDLHTTSLVGSDGLPIYTAGDYTFALSVVPIGVALGIFLSFFLKETHCQSLATAEEEALFTAAPAASTMRTLEPETEAV